MPWSAVPSTAPTGQRNEHLHPRCIIAEFSLSCPEEVDLQPSQRLAEKGLLFGEV